MEEYVKTVKKNDERPRSFKTIQHLEDIMSDWEQVQMFSGTPATSKAEPMDVNYTGTPPKCQVCTGPHYTDKCDQMPNLLKLYKESKKAGSKGQPQQSKADHSEKPKSDNDGKKKSKGNGNKNKSPAQSDSGKKVAHVQGDEWGSGPSGNGGGAGK